MAACLPGYPFVSLDICLPISLVVFFFIFLLVGLFRRFWLWQGDFLVPFWEDSGNSSMMGEQELVAACFGSDVGV
jgi:hypothetical protein